MAVTDTGMKWLAIAIVRAAYTIAIGLTYMGTGYSGVVIKPEEWFGV